jgi:hypothetical protein
MSQTDATAQLRGIASEFQAMQNRSLELFTGLSDLPSYVGSKIWGKPYSTCSSYSSAIQWIFGLWDWFITLAMAHQPLNFLFTVSAFQKAFSVFTRVWKYQQQNRTALENEDCFGLKRHEIGEIASKIGQLYYQ